MNVILAGPSVLEKIAFVVFAVGALAWGATHSKSTGDGIGSAKNQAAAKAMLQTGLTLPAATIA